MRITVRVLFLVVSQAVVAAHSAEPPPPRTITPEVVVSATR